jgi:hypothetical protein
MKVPRQYPLVLLDEEKKGRSEVEKGGGMKVGARERRLNRSSCKEYLGINCASKKCQHFTIKRSAVFGNNCCLFMRIIWNT